MRQKLSRPNQQILEEAAVWFATFRSQELAESARHEFQEWLKRSPEHIRAYLEIAATYADIPAPDEGRTPPELIAMAKASAEINVRSLNAGRQRAGGEAASAASSKARGSLASRVALAASVLIFVGIGSWFYFERNTYRTDIGEQRSVTLSDGSIVELNARSKVHIAFGDDERDVELIAGQALFRVAKDHRRPFIVHAGATSVRAVGTQFDVYRKSTGTTVTVIEGRVAVLSKAGETPGLAAEPLRNRTSEGAGPEAMPKHPPDANASTPGRMMQAFLGAGEQMTVTPSGAEKSERPNIAAATAWTQHQLVFDGTPLADVLEEFSRYTTRRLVIDSPELAQLRISGQYTSSSPDSLLRFLRLQKGVVVTESGGETHIRRE
jgi:transmembrane sensor